MIDILFREERTESPTASAVKFVIDRRETGPKKTELRDIERILYSEDLRIEADIRIRIEGE
jgi:hypothetical protein